MVHSGGIDFLLRSRIHGLSPLAITGPSSGLYNLITSGRRFQRLHHYPAFDGLGLRRTGPNSRSAVKAKRIPGPVTWIRQG